MLVGRSYNIMGVVSMEVIYKTIYYSIHTPSFFPISLLFADNSNTIFLPNHHFLSSWYQSPNPSHFLFFFGVHLVIFVAVETVVGPKEQDDLKGCKRGCCTAWYGGGNSTKAVAVLSKKTFSLLNRSNGWLNCYIFISLYYMYYTVLESSCMWNDGFKNEDITKQINSFITLLLVNIEWWVFCFSFLLHIGLSLSLSRISLRRGVHR